jgi:formylglycine-generating enzyme required for sulfatase activity
MSLDLRSRWPARGLSLGTLAAGRACSTTGKGKVKPTSASGCWLMLGVHCRFALRARVKPDCRDKHMGFRLTAEAKGISGMPTVPH